MRRINRLADLSLLVGFAENMPHISAACIENVADELTAIPSRGVERARSVFSRNGASLLGKISRHVVHQPVRIVALNSLGRPSASISAARRSWS